MMRRGLESSRVGHFVVDTTPTRILYQRNPMVPQNPLVGQMSRKLLFQMDSSNTIVVGEKKFDSPLQQWPLESTEAFLFPVGRAHNSATKRIAGQVLLAPRCFSGAFFFPIINPLHPCLIERIESFHYTGITERLPKRLWKDDPPQTPERK